MIANLRLAFVLVTIISVTLVSAPMQMAAIAASRRLARKLPVLWHRLVLFLLGARINVSGKIPQKGPVLVVANHISWSDILILGGTFEACFIAKQEVRTLPGLNLLAWLQRSVFVDREKRRDTHQQADTISARLLEGDTMVLFAEGTTNDGIRVFPFKSALFGAAQYALRNSQLDSISVVPVAIAYTHLFGLPLGRYHQTLAAWPGDIPLLPHFLNFFRKGAYNVEVCIAEPIPFTRQTNRRQLAAQTHEIVSSLFAETMRGRT